MFEVVLGTNNVWKITAPQELAAEESRVKDLLTKLGELTATQFVADVATDLAKYGLATPLATVSLRGEGTNLLAQLLVDAPEPNNVVRHVKRADEPFIYGVATNALDWLPSSDLDWRARRVAELKTNDVTRIVIEKPAGKTVLVKDKDGHWKMVEPLQGVLDNDGLNQMIETVSHLSATEFVQEGLDNLAAYGLDKPAVRFTVTVAAKTYTAQVGKATATGDLYVSWSDPALIFTMPGYGLTAVTRDVVTTQSALTTTNQPPAAVPPANPPAPVP